MIWRSTLPRLRFGPEEGIEVIATGKITTFPGQSKYQIAIEALEPAGIGALMALLEERRKKLAAEGLFDEARKRPLPYLPRTIGVITSPTGAVIRDIVHRLDDRFPVHVLLWPVTVQGETAAAEVAGAIRGFNALRPGDGVPRPDVIIVARGGGSLEDLWSFNEEIVVRAAAESAIPLISAVGHETDWTLIDHVADRRAPTPTGAAEMAVPVRSELVAAVDGLAARHRGAVGRRIEAARREVVGLARALPKADDLLAIPRRTVDDLSSRLGRGLHANAHLHRVQLERSAARLSLSRLALFLDGASDRLGNLSGRKRRAFVVLADGRRAGYARLSERLRLEPIDERLAFFKRRLSDAEASTRRCIDRRIADDTGRVRAFDQLLRTLSYKSVLARGFALVRSEGQPIHGAAQVAAGSPLDLEFQDGHVSAVATSGSADRHKKKKEKPVSSSGSQGSLF